MAREDLELLDKVNKLLNLRVGDHGRLEHIKDSLEKKKQLYVSDKTYLQNLLKKHALENSIPDKIQPKNKSEKPKTSIPKKEIHKKIISNEDNNTDYVKIPVGIRILSILSYVFGILFIIAGIVMLALIPMLIDLAGPVDIVDDSTSNEIFVALYEMIFVLLAALVSTFFAGAVVAILVGYGMIRLRTWSWWLLILAILIPMMFIPVESFVIEPMLTSSLDNARDTIMWGVLREMEDSSSSEDLISIALMIPIFAIQGLVVWYLFKKRTYFGNIRKISKTQLSMIVSLVSIPHVVTLVAAFLMLDSLIKAIQIIGSTS